MDAKILVVDDDKSIRSALSMILSKKYIALTAKNADEALKLVHDESPEIVLLDIRLQEDDGVEVLEQIKARYPEVTVIMVTAVEEVKTIVRAIKLGAYDYLVKPIDAQDLMLSLEHALENRALKKQLRTIQKPKLEKYKFDLIGKNPVIKASIEIARKASQSPDTPLLIMGESGAGKGVLAKATHYQGCDIPGPFITVNCGAIAKDLVESELFGYERGAFTGARSDGRKGHFEEAAGGTLFLDEIGAMPLSAQVKLLAVLEDRAFYRIGGSRRIRVSARIIAATNTDLDEAVEAGTFRRDLFFRLNVIRVDLPPLRRRPEDIILLTQHFMDQYNKKFGKNFARIDAKAQTMLLEYNWPGNVRELRNTVERIILIENGNALLPEHLHALGSRNGNQTAGTKPRSKPKYDYQEVTKNLIQEAMESARGNVTEAARLMKIPPHKLRYRIKKYGLTYKPD